MTLSDLEQEVLVAAAKRDWDRVSVLLRDASDAHVCWVVKVVESGHPGFSRSVAWRSVLDHDLRLRLYDFLAEQEHKQKTDE